VVLPLIQEVVNVILVLVDTIQLTALIRFCRHAILVIIDVQLVQVQTDA